MVKFGVYEREGATLNDLGTLRSVIGKKGKLAFIRKNFNDATKRVALILTNAAGQTATVSCSEQLSKLIRTKQVKVAQLLELSVVENEEGVAFVSMPATGALQEFAVDSIKGEEFESKAEFLPEELIA